MDKSLVWIRPAQYYHQRLKAQLKQLIEQAVTEVCNLRAKGLWFCVNEVESSDTLVSESFPARTFSEIRRATAPSFREKGQTPIRIKVWATLHFTPAGAPYCCTEPQCHLSLFEDRLAAVGEYARQFLKLNCSVELDFANRISAKCYSHQSDEA